MRKMKEAANNLMWRGVMEWNRFKAGERGDTNFISILLIIGIVVVLAGLLLSLGKDVMQTVSDSVMDFLDSLQN